MIEVNYPPFLTSKVCLRSGKNTPSPLKLFKNEIVEGRVLQSLSNGDALLLIKGKRVTARSYIPLRKGSILSLQVEKMEPIPIFKFLGIKFSDSHGIDIPILLSAIKENTWKSILEHIHCCGLPKEVVSPFKELMHDLCEGLFLKSTPKLLAELMDKSGLQWETKLRKTLQGKKIGRAVNLDNLIQRDLKGLTSRCLDLKPDSEGFEGEDLLERFVSTIKNFQLLNRLGFEQGKKIFLPIPMQFSNGLFTLGQLLMRLPQGDRDTGREIEDDPFHITFLLEFSNLGPLRTDISVYEREIEGRFFLTKEEGMSLVKSNIPSLVNILRDKGFTVRSLSCRLKDPELIKQSLIGEIIQQEGNTISLVA